MCSVLLSRERHATTGLSIGEQPCTEDVFGDTVEKRKLLGDALRDEELMP